MSGNSLRSHPDLHNDENVGEKPFLSFLKKQGEMLPLKLKIMATN